MCAYCATYAVPIITLTEQPQCAGREDANDNKCNAGQSEALGSEECGMELMLCWITFEPSTLVPYNLHPCVSSCTHIEAHYSYSVSFVLLVFTSGHISVNLHSRDDTILAFSFSRSW